MPGTHERFASPDELAHWRAFALIDGWQVSGNLAPGEGEIRLFDAPITDGMFTPSIRIRELACSRIIPGTCGGKEASEDIVKIRKGWLFATDSRFIAHNESTREGINVPYDKIINVEYKNGDFFLTIDHRAIIRERVMAQPKPPKPFGMDNEEYERNILTPIFLEASHHVLTAVLIHTKFPQSGLLDFAAVIGAKSNLERLVYANVAGQRNQFGSDFVSAFFYFLNEISDKNRLAQR